MELAASEAGELAAAEQRFLAAGDFHRLCVAAAEHWRKGRGARVEELAAHLGVVLDASARERIDAVLARAHTDAAGDGVRDPLIRIQVVIALVRARIAGHHSICSGRLITSAEVPAEVCLAVRDGETLTVGAAPVANSPTAARSAWPKELADAGESAFLRWARTVSDDRTRVGTCSQHPTLAGREFSRGPHTLALSGHEAITKLVEHGVSQSLDLFVGNTFVRWPDATWGSRAHRDALAAAEQGLIAASEKRAYGISVSRLVADESTAHQPLYRVARQLTVAQGNSFDEFLRATHRHPPEQFETLRVILSQYASPSRDKRRRPTATTHAVLRVPGWRSLRHLILVGVTLSPELWADIAALESLTTLELRGCDLVDIPASVAMSFRARAVPLERLKLWVCRADASFAGLVKQLRGLRELDVSRCSERTDSYRVYTNDADATAVSPTLVSALAGLSALESVRLVGYPEFMSGLSAALESLAGLRHLAVIKSTLGARSRGRLLGRDNPFSGLETLDLTQTAVLDDVALARRRLPALEHLRLGDCGLSERFPKALARAPFASQLRSLELWAEKPRFTADGVARLLSEAPLTRLSSLELAAEHLLDDEVLRAIATRLGGLRRLSSSRYGAASAAGLAAVLESPHIDDLEIKTPWRSTLYVKSALAPRLPMDLATS